MRSRSHSSLTSVWIGVAVPSRRFFVRGPICSMKSSRLFGSLLLVPEPAAPARLVRLVQDHGPVLALEQMLALLGVVEDQAGRDDGDLERATGDVFRASRLDDVAVRVEPDLLRRRPHRARNAELVRQLHLPLQRQGGRAEDQHRAVVQQRRDHGARRERQRLADADFVGEQQPRLAVRLAVLQEHRHEGALPGLKLLATAVDRAFGQRGGRELLGRRLVEANLDAIGDALDLFDDGVG